MPVVLEGLLTSVRPRQWSKNLIVLAPLAFSQRLTDPPSVRQALAALSVFTAAAAAIYLFNDLIDRPQDRLHPLKRHRPLAAGTLAPRTAMVAAILLATTALVAATILGLRFAILLAAYLVANCLYSGFLKRVVILDVMIVSFGFLLRVGAGAAAIGVEVSTWLLLCTSFVSLLLAFSKRRHELVLLPGAGQRAVLSSYRLAFLDPVIGALTAATILSYSLYAVAPETVEKFDTRSLIYTLPFVLYGVFRFLHLVYHVENERSPTETMLSDKPFLFNILLWISATVIVIYLL